MKQVDSLSIGNSDDIYIRERRSIDAILFIGRRGGGRIGRIEAGGRTRRREGIRNVSTTATHPD